MKKFLDVKIDDESWRINLLRTFRECFDELVEMGTNLSENRGNNCGDFVVDLQFCVMYKSYKVKSLNSNLI